ncbi:MAG: hypothetical protein AAGA85_16835 [Bacteroidota bacterium]
MGDINDFSAHLTGSSSFGDVTNADRAVFTTIAAGLEYNYWVVPSLGFMFRATQPVWGDYELRDAANDALRGFNSDFD